jgi:hypothetical protein
VSIRIDNLSISHSEQRVGEPVSMDNRKSSLIDKTPRAHEGNVPMHSY